LRGEVRAGFCGWLQAKRPDLVPEYERLYANNRAYLPAKKRAEISSLVRGWGSGRRMRRARQSGMASSAGDAVVGDPRRPQAKAEAGGGGHRGRTRGRAAQSKRF